MVSFPRCKINLGLNILSQRDDGFHNIETCFYPVPWTDILEIIPSNTFSIKVTGKTFFGNDEDNLCARAYILLKKEYGISPVQIHLHKIIPTGAGLGGGSSDAAATLNTLNDIFSLGISSDRLRYYASLLGSDCPFFIDPKPMLGTGKGELLAPTPLTLQGKFLVLIKPDIHVASVEAYRGVRSSVPEFRIAETLGLPITEWKEKLVNDFETSVFQTHPEIHQIKKHLYELGAQYASMSGSGSSVYGLFDREINLQGSFPRMQIWSGVPD